MASDSIILVSEEPRGPSQLIELIVNTGKTKVQFQDSATQQLRSTTTEVVIIKKIRLVTLDVMTFGPLSGNPNATLGETVKCSLVLYSEGWERAQYIPLLVLNDVATPAGTFPYRFQSTKFDNWKNVDWSKSYVQFSNGTAAAGGPYVFMFEVEYVKLDNFGNPVERAS